jgi:hypothetical protein
MVEFNGATIRGRLVQYDSRGLCMRALELIYPSGRRVKVSRTVWASLSAIKRFYSPSRRKNG